MAIFTPAEIQEQKAAFKAALRACALNQEYTIDGETFRRADLPRIRETLEWLDREERKLLGTGAGPFYTQATFRRPL